MTPKQAEIAQAIKILGGRAYLYQLADQLDVPKGSIRQRLNTMLRNGIVEIEPYQPESNPGPARKYYRLVKKL